MVAYRGRIAPIDLFTINPFSHTVVTGRRVYLGTLTLEIKTLHWIFSRHHVDHKTVPLIHGFTLRRSKILCEVGPRGTSPGTRTRAVHGNAWHERARLARQARLSQHAVRDPVQLS